MIKRLFGLILNRWVLTAVGLLAVALLIWFVGPFLAIHTFRPLETAWARWTLIGLLVAFIIGRKLWRVFKARRANAALMKGLLRPVAPPVEPNTELAAEEIAQLQTRFEEALALMKKSRFGGDKPSLWARLRALGSKRYLYDLPWYVFIGAPGSGKTTALVNSGLRFPLDATLGRSAVRGVGGTRNCDWWFTDEAILLDTAGRYATHESNQQEDSAAWGAFLKLLKQSRPRRPINGVLVTVSVADLLEAGPAARETQAHALRARVQELAKNLGIRFPVYLLVTKSDLLAGFTEFFANLGKEGRTEVWGVSLPYAETGVNQPALTSELERLERRLYDRLPERLEEERDPTKRALIYGFPQQFAALQERLLSFVASTLMTTKYELTPVFRGVYFTSGTQEGSPIDRVMSSLARTFGLRHSLPARQHPGGRSYFLTRLLREVIFPEAGLSGVNLRSERRRQRIQWAAIAGAGAVLVLATVAWAVSYQSNRRYVADVSARTKAVEGPVSALPVRGGNDLVAILPTLERVRTLAWPEPDNTPAPWSMRLGLYQGGKLDGATSVVYLNLLQDTFLPSLATLLETRLRQSTSGPLESLYESLKAYVMLYDPAHFNSETLWSLLPPSVTDSDASVKPSFDTLYERGWVAPPTLRNDALIAEVRSKISHVTLPSRIYDRLKRELGDTLPPFTIVEKGGPRAMLVFDRASGEPITKGVPGLFTYDGYHQKFSTKLDEVARQLSEEEAWVLGPSGSFPDPTLLKQKVTEAVKRLYLEEYRVTWRRFVNDIGVARRGDLARTIEVAQALSAQDQDNPLRKLLTAIKRETTLAARADGEPSLIDKAKAKAIETAGRVGASSWVGAPGAVPLEKLLVDDHFEDVRRLVAGAGGGPAPIDPMIQALNGIYQYFVSAKAAFETGQAPPPVDAANTVRAESRRLPEPLRSMVGGLVEDGVRQVNQRTREKQEVEHRQEQDKVRAEQRATRERIDAELRQIGEFCVKAINGRYPFVRSSTQDVTALDFTSLFSPGGSLDGFFQKNLASIVDISKRPWTFKEAAWGSSAALEEFRKAQVIRDVFFRAGAQGPSLTIEFKPLEMDAAIQQFTLNVDGKPVKYAHGPLVPTRVQFPGPDARNLLRITISPAPASGSSGLGFEGPWAIFRMLDSVKIDPSSQPERLQATFSVAGRQAVFEIWAPSVRNPFRLPELTAFRCPTAL